MGTKLSFDYDKSLFSKIKHPFEEPFYCKENSSVVLQRLISKYHVKKYNSIETNWCDRVYIPSSDDKTVFPKLTINGLNIRPYENNNGLRINKSYKDFNPGVPESDFSIKHAQMIVDGMIVKYMVDVKVLNYGIAGVFSRPPFSMGRQEAVSYLDARTNEKDKLKEQHLEDIIIYGKVVFGKSFGFNEEYIKNVLDKTVSEIPPEFDPRFGPANPGMFH